MGLVLQLTLPLWCSHQVYQDSLLHPLDKSWLRLRGRGKENPPPSCIGLTQASQSYFLPIIIIAISCHSDGGVCVTILTDGAGDCCWRRWVRCVQWCTVAVCTLLGDVWRQPPTAHVHQTFINGPLLSFCRYPSMFISWDYLLAQ